MSFALLLVSFALLLVNSCGTHDFALLLVNLLVLLVSFALLLVSLCRYS
ncbi:hypothetical protein [Peribacillus frigoritolerans]|nr:hypothetical protein [Peribacillus frigoritolerans]